MVKAKRNIDQDKLQIDHINLTGNMLLSYLNLNMIYIYIFQGLIFLSLKKCSFRDTRKKDN